MPRSARTNPQPGDVIQWKDWRITVLRREVVVGNGDQVTYRAARKDGHTKPDAACSVAEWKERAKGARVVEEGLDNAQCVATAYVSGPCDVDRVPIEGLAHCAGLNIRCEAHCTGSHRA
jgi:hypothetical protein